MSSRIKYECQECEKEREELYVFENTEVCAWCFKTLSEKYGYAEPEEGWPGH